MKGFEAGQVMNGTWGELWFDGEYMAEVISCKAEINGKYTAITRTRHLMDGQKLTGLEGKGEVKFHKTSSFIMQKVQQAFKEGKTPTATIITKVDDPGAIGAERVALYHCAFDKAILADWEAGKQMEESYSFTFDDWKLLDVA